MFPIIGPFLCAPVFPRRASSWVIKQFSLMSSLWVWVLLNSQYFKVFLFKKEWKYFNDFPLQWQKNSVGNGLIRYSIG